MKTDVKFNRIKENIELDNAIKYNLIKGRKINPEFYDYYYDFIESCVNENIDTNKLKFKEIGICSYPTYSYHSNNVYDICKNHYAIEGHKFEDLYDELKEKLYEDFMNNMRFYVLVSYEDKVLKLEYDGYNPYFVRSDEQLKYDNITSTTLPLSLLHYEDSILNNCKNHVTSYVDLKIKDDDVYNKEDQIQSTLFEDSFYYISTDRPREILEDEFIENMLNEFVNSVIVDIAIYKLFEISHDESDIITFEFITDICNYEAIRKSFTYKKLAKMLNRLFNV